MQNNLLPDFFEDFGFPITLVFSETGKIFMSERVTGRLWQVDTKRVITTFPLVPLLGHNECGLIGIVLDPDFEDNGYIYCFYSYGTGENDIHNRVVRIKEDGTGLQILLDNLPGGMIHEGGIMTFGSDKTLYIGVGVQNEIEEKAQDVTFLGGKILRINRDGSIPLDNPFKDSPVYSYGHRNVFGLAFHPITNKLYECEIGPEINDEINIIEAGGNYGWPLFSGYAKDTKFKDPIKVYSKVITPVQGIFVNKDFYFVSYNEGTVHKLILEGDDFNIVVKDEIMYEGKPWSMVGLFYAPDNQFYLTTATGVHRIELSYVRDSDQ